MINIAIYILLSLQTSIETQIETMNKRMEEAFNAGDMLKVAQFYADDAVLLGPDGRQVIGREDIDAYWQNIQNPISWELDVIAVSTEERDIYENAYYKALENGLPKWRVLGHEFDNRKNLVYQLGHSTLKTKRGTSEVDFILIGQATDDGYKILLDTYSP